LEGATPARLYATLVGALLVIAGIIGFFYGASFGSPGSVEEVFGIFSVNGWHNVFHIATGAIGLLVAGYAARQYALWIGLLYIAVAAWGFVLGSGHAILDVIPIDSEDNVLHLIVGVFGVGAFLATPRAETVASTQSLTG
jgi:hypothetical protein